VLEAQPITYQKAKVREAVLRGGGKKGPMTKGTPNDRSDPTYADESILDAVGYLPKKKSSITEGYGAYTAQAES